MFSDSTLKKIGCFVGGVVFGTAGVKLLSSKDAKKGIYKLYCGCAEGKRLRYEDCYNSSGECRGYPCRSTTDQ